jgi:hypothetical protein
MQIDGFSASSLRRQVDPACAAPASETRALVALAPIADTSERQPVHRHAPFLAHLIAVKDQHPQTRERRRAEPNEALAAYRATVALSQSH